jgi:glycosyltransferase involved in cell wall biosynthesis
MCPNIQFDVIGRVDPNMLDIVNQLKLEPNVRLNNDYVSDEEMRSGFIECDWVILPYNSASQSGVIIDAYKYSRPVIAFSVGAISEQVEDGVSGYLIKPGDNNAFSNKLKDVISMDNNEYEALCRTAYEYGAKKYAASGAVDRFVEMIDEK